MTIIEQTARVKNLPESFSGIFTAIVTPFEKDGSIDWQAFESIIENQVNRGIDGVVIAGTTGESPTLSVQEKLSLIRKAKALTSGNIHVMAGTGGQSTKQSVELSKLAADAGADSLLVVTPPYNKPNIQGLLGHFQAINNEVGLPICLYHVPGRTAQKLSHSELSKICELERVSIVKEASGDLNFFSKAIGSIPNQVFLSGDDPTFLPSLAIGAKGCISVISNIYPAAMKALLSAFNSGDTSTAMKIHHTLAPLMEALFVETNPCPLKYCMHYKGFGSNTLRLPLAPISVEHETILKEQMDQTDRLLSQLDLKG
ncbi:MAG: 4-hydroxy-tetrahydrodipicolinate synthase [Oligoflexales bacterium]